MLAKGVRFSPTEGYAWDFSTNEKKEPVIPSECNCVYIFSLLLVCNIVSAVLQLKWKQTNERLERKKEQSTRVDAIIVQLMKQVC